MAGDRDAFEAAVKKAHSYAWEKRWMKAIEQYELATAEFPDDTTARSGLAFAYYKGERLREALREYRKLRELRPDDPAPVSQIAQILQKLGRTSDAAEAWMALGELCAQQKNLERAKEAWQAAARLQPANKEAHRKLAEAYGQQSDSTEAAKEYSALARLWHKEGDTQQAAKYCQQALLLDGGNKAARSLLERLSSEEDLVAAAPALVVRREELGPVEEAVRASLSTLAEALFADTELADPSATVGTEGDSGEPASRAAQSIGAILGKAIDLHSRGMIEEALGYYEKALESGVARVEVVFSLGLLNKELSRFDEAVSHLQRSVEVPEYGLASHLGLGQCYWAQGRASEALGHFLQALKLIDVETLGEDREGDLDRAYEKLEESGWGRGDGRGSELALHSLMELLAGSEWKDNIDEARRRLDGLAEDGVVPILPEVLDIPGGDEVVDTMIRSRECLNRGMPFTALEECYRAIRLAPTYLALHLRLAEIFAQQGKAEEAVSKYAAVAEAYLTRDNPTMAMEVFRRALEAAPMSISIRERLIDLQIAHGEIDQALDEYVALGESYYRLARVDEALSRYEQALSLVNQTEAPVDWRVRILHRVADLHMQRVHWKEATAIYEQILELQPDDDQARFRLVDLRYKLGQEDRALRDVDALIVHYGKLNDLRRVTEMLKELVASNPQDVSLRSRLGGVYIELGMKEEAIAELDTLGEMQLQAGRKKEAMETLQTIISLGPSEKEGYTQLLRELTDTMNK